MQKTLAVFVLALFLVSLVPGALAQETTTDVRGNPERMQKEARQDARNTVTEKREQRDTRGNAVSTAVRGRIQEHKEAFASFRTQLQDCKGQRTPACEQLRKDVRNRAKFYLKDVVQNVLENLKAAREQAATAPVVDDAAVQELDAAIDAVETTEDTVAALPEEASATQVQTVTNTVQEKVKKAQHAIKTTNTRKANAGVHGVITRAEQLEKKLDNVLARLKEKGADTTAADTEVAAFKEHIALARTNADTAQAKLTAARAQPDNAEALLTEGRAALAEARTHLREAHTALKNAVRAIKALKNGAATLAEETSQPESTDSGVSSTMPVPGTNTTEMVVENTSA